jgi:hypothetical protein
MGETGHYGTIRTPPKLALIQQFPKDMGGLVTPIVPYCDITIPPRSEHNHGKKTPV